MAAGGRARTLSDKALPTSASTVGCASPIVTNVALDLDDVHQSARKGHLVVCYGKGGRYRERSPRHSALRSTLDSCVADRARWSRGDGTVDGASPLSDIEWACSTATCANDRGGLDG